MLAKNAHSDADRCLDPAPEVGSSSLYSVSTIFAAYEIYDYGYQT